MQFETFDQMFQFRRHCVCGSLLEGFFRCTTADDEYVTISPRLLNSTASPDSMSLCLGFEIDSRIVPSGIVYFDLFIKRHSKDFEINAQYLSSPYDQISAFEFAKKYFCENEQNNLNITIHVNCADERCPYDYKSKFGRIIFDLDTKTVNNFSIINERFILTKNDRRYVIISNFYEDKTIIKYQAEQNKPANDAIEMSAQNFAKYPLDAKFLLDKIGTLFLFS